MNQDKVLLVDDDPLILKTLKRQVESLGYPCQSCKSAEEALDLRQRESYRILICDWQLPGMSGLDVCRQVRRETQYTYILLLTGTEGPEAKLQALDAGADAFLAKPASPADLRAHIQTGQRILCLQRSLEGRLQELEEANRDLLQQIELRQQAEASRDRLSREAREFEVRVAAQVQGRLLVSPAPLDPFLDIASYNQPSKQVDGDFLDFFRHSQGMDWVVGDVMGKGIPAALLGAGIKTQLLRILAEPRAGQLDNVVTLLNQKVCDDLVSLDSFVTMFYARCDVAQRLLSFVDAGHTKPLLFQACNQRVVSLEGPNCPLGFTPHETFCLGHAELQTGDCMVFFSDGLTEATNRQGEAWGEAGLEAAFVASQGGSAQQTLSQILTRFCDFQEQGASADDVSLLVVRVQYLPPPDLLHLATLQCASDLGNLEEIRQFVLDEVVNHLPERPDEVWCFQLQLAVTELASNVIRHAYAGKPGKWVHLLLSLTLQEVRLRIFHQGLPISPEALRAEPIREPQEGGMGMFLVQRITDELETGQMGALHWIEFSKSLPGIVAEEGSPE